MGAGKFVTFRFLPNMINFTIFTISQFVKRRPDRAHPNDVFTFRFLPNALHDVHNSQFTICQKTTRPRAVSLSSGHRRWQTHEEFIQILVRTQMFSRRPTPAIQKIKDSDSDSAGTTLVPLRFPLYTIANIIFLSSAADLIQESPSHQSED